LLFLPVACSVGLLRLSLRHQTLDIEISICVDASDKQLSSSLLLGFRHYGAVG